MSPQSVVTYLMGGILKKNRFHRKFHRQPPPDGACRGTLWKHRPGAASCTVFRYGQRAGSREHMAATIRRFNADQVPPEREKRPSAMAGTSAAEGLSEGAPGTDPGDEGDAGRQDFKRTETLITIAFGEDPAHPRVEHGGAGHPRMPRPTMLWNDLSSCWRKVILRCPTRLRKKLTLSAAAWRASEKVMQLPAEKPALMKSVVVTIFRELRQGSHRRRQDEAQEPERHTEYGRSHIRGEQRPCHGRLFR